MNGDIPDAGLNYHERLERLEEGFEKLGERLDSLEAARLEDPALMRAIGNGQATKATWPHILGEIALGSIGILVIVACVLLALWTVMVRNPWPLTFSVPPPHSTQLPKEMPTP